LIGRGVIASRSRNAFISHICDNDTQRRIQNSGEVPRPL